MNYRDSKDEIYKVGDIVYNPCIGDYWVVQQCTEQDKQNYGLETDYCLALNNDKDDYVIDIDMPSGFEIAIRPGDEHYDEAIDELNELAQKRREWISNNETSIKEDDK